MVEDTDNINKDNVSMESGSKSNLSILSRSDNLILIVIIFILYYRVKTFLIHQTYLFILIEKVQCEDILM